MTENEVVIERLDNWIKNTKEYRDSLDSRMKELDLKLAFLNDRYLVQPTKCEDRILKKVWAIIVITLGIPSTILVILQILKWKP